MHRSLNTTLERLKSSLSATFASRRAEWLAQWEADFKKAHWHGVKNLNEDLVLLVHPLEGGTPNPASLGTRWVKWGEATECSRSRVGGNPLEHLIKVCACACERRAVRNWPDAYEAVSARPH